MDLEVSLSGKCFRTCLLLLFSVLLSGAAGAGEIVCWFPPGAEAAKCKAIADGLTKASGLAIAPRVAISYRELLEAFGNGPPSLVYAGSFAQAIIEAKSSGVPLVQKIDGRELYAGIFIYPAGEDPASILRKRPAEIAFAEGATSGESCARAATGGQAAIRVKNHAAAANAVKVGKAAGAFVKDFWWHDHRGEYPGLELYEVPGISLRRNPDNILTASRSLEPGARDMIIRAAQRAPDAFGGSMEPFDGTRLGFTLELMKRGGIDPASY